MTVNDAYSDAVTYRAAIDKTDTGEDAEILTDLTAITRYLESRLGRFFTKDAADVTRLYVPRSTGMSVRQDWAESENPYKWGGMSRVLSIDDLAALTSIKIDQNRDGLFTDETALAATDFELFPRNAALGPEPMPYTSIGLTSWGATWAFPTGCRVQVIGKWGWPAIPESIKRAVIHLTAILRLETPRAQATISELGQLVQSSSQARGIVDELVRNYARIAF